MTKLSKESGLYKDVEAVGSFNKADQGQGHGKKSQREVTKGSSWPGEWKRREKMDTLLYHQRWKAERGGTTTGDVDMGEISV